MGGGTPELVELRYIKEKNCLEQNFITIIANLIVMKSSDNRLFVELYEVILIKKIN